MRRLLLALLLAAAPALATAPLAAAAPATTQCPATGGVKVQPAASPATVSVNDVRTSEPVDVVVTITGATFAIAALPGEPELLSATWCVKSSVRSTDPSPGTGLAGASPSTNKKGVVQSIGYVTVYGVYTSPAAEACYDSTSDNGDLRLVGPVDTDANTWVYESTDGTCVGGLWQVAATVSAADRATADAKCAALDRGEGYGLLSDDPFLYVGAPTDWWLCTKLDIR